MIALASLAIAGLSGLGIGLLIVLREERKMHRLREKAWEGERRELLTRIQAPQVAPLLTDQPTTEMQHVAFDDDDAFWDASEDLGSPKVES